MVRMTSWRRAVAAGLVAVAGSAMFAAPAFAETYSGQLRTAIGSLPVATEVRTGYNRDLFTHWVDADSDGCNTRYEVLIIEAVTVPSVGSGCSLTGGRWYSYYDNKYWTLPADLDIDHFVPLAEAWDSGARLWTSAQRKSFANDLGDTRSLAAVTDNENQSKSDQDPATWMPSYATATCRYIGEWVAVKLRWRLKVDTAEKAALASAADGCSNVTITVARAI